MQTLNLIGITVLVIGLVVAASIAAMWLSSLSRDVAITDRQYALRRERASDTYDMFEGAFTGVPSHIARAVHNHFSNRVFARKGFPVRPWDSLEEIYGLTRGDSLDLAIREIGHQLGLQLVPSAEDPVSTVGDLVLLLARIDLRTRTERAASSLLRAANAEETPLLRPAPAMTSAPPNLVRPSTGHVLEEASHEP